MGELHPPYQLPSSLAILPYSDYLRALFMADNPGNTMLSNRIHWILLRPLNAELDDDHEC